MQKHSAYIKTAPLALIIALIFFVFIIPTFVEAKLSTKSFGPYDEITYSNVAGKNWGFSYIQNNKHYFNINGKTFGPYNEIWDKKVAGENYYFMYKTGSILDEDSFVNINGKIYGPYKRGIGAISTANKNWTYVFSDESGNKVNINGTIYGPYYYIEELKTSFTSWGFIFQDKDENYFANIKGQIYGPYKNINYFDMYNNEWAFQYFVKNDKAESEVYVNISGKVFGPYEDQVLAANHEYPWSFENRKTVSSDPSIPKEYYVNIKGITYGPYKQIFGRANEYEFQNYSEADQNFEVLYYLNGKIYGPFTELRNFNTSFFHGAFSSVGNKKSIILYDGKNFGPVDDVFISELSDYQDNTINPNSQPKIQIFPFLKNNKVHFYVNGKTYGPFDYIKRDYIKSDQFNYVKKNSSYEMNADMLSLFYQNYEPIRDFGTIAVNNNNWGFSYYLNNKIYLNINGKIYGPYANSDAAVSLTVGQNFWGLKYNDKSDTLIINGTKLSLKKTGFSDFITVGQKTGYQYNLNNLSYYKVNNQNFGPFGEKPTIINSNDRWLIKYGNGRQGRQASRTYQNYIKLISW